MDALKAFVEHDDPLDFFEEASLDSRVAVFHEEEEGVLCNDERLSGDLCKKDYDSNVLNNILFSYINLPNSVETATRLEAGPDLQEFINDNLLGVLVQLPSHWLFKSEISSVEVGSKYSDTPYIFLTIDNYEELGPSVNQLYKKGLSTQKPRIGYLLHMIQSSYTGRVKANGRGERKTSRQGEAWLNYYG